MPRRPQSPDRNGVDVVNLVVRFPVDLHEQAKRAARAEDLSLSQLIRRLTRSYLDTTTEGNS